MSSNPHVTNADLMASLSPDWLSKPRSTGVGARRGGRAEAISGQIDVSRDGTANIPELNGGMFSDLNVLDATCRHRSFTTAADELGVSRPAVSMTIARLERHVAVNLFCRVGRCMEPTDAALKLQRSFIAARAQIERVLRTVRTADRPLVISLPRSLASFWIGDLWTAFLNGVSAVSVCTHSDGIEPDYSQVDIAVTFTADDYPHLQTIHLCDEELILACSPRYASNARDLSDRLGLLTFLEYDIWSLSLWESISRPHMKPSRIVRIADASILIDAVLAGAGIALLPKLLTANLIRQGSLIKLWETSVPTGRRYYIRTLKESSDGKLAAMTDLLVAEARIAGGVA